MLNVKVNRKDGKKKKAVKGIADSPQRENRAKYMDTPVGGVGVNTSQVDVQTVNDGSSIEEAHTDDSDFA